ncbi:DUF1542 domain-containing protein [Nocardia sp. NPDC048505]|uniref:DUF1542 domain-containing protein n=1 Tax=unclassified Nocardia TaxID=2637762 RepID=UPI0033CA19C9
MIWLLLLLVVVIVIVLLVMRPKGGPRGLEQIELDDALAEARRENERLGGQVYNLAPTNEAAAQALADAAERHNAAGSQLAQAGTPTQARLAKQTAVEGLYYIRAARTAMNMDPGPAIPQLAFQNRAGRVTEDRTISLDGRRLATSPHPSDTTPHYYPGGMVAGRPVPGGWYSEPWWRTALLTGAWAFGATTLFAALFTGMPGIGYDAGTFEQGFDTDAQDYGYGDTGYDQGGYTQGDYGQGDYPQGDYGQSGYTPDAYGNTPYGDDSFGTGGFDNAGFDTPGFDSSF